MLVCVSAELLDFGIPIWRGPLKGTALPTGDSDTTARTMRALELLAQEPRTQAQLATLLGVHAQTARRMLARLEALGYVRGPDAERRYGLTLKLAAVGANAARRLSLVKIASPYVVRLRNETDETAHLCVPQEDGVMHLVEESGASAALMPTQVGETMPYHSTAAGKAVLAHRPSLVRRLLKDGLRRRTQNTLVDPADLLLALAFVRERGYAHDDCENESDVRCAAAPVFDRAGSVIAAIGVSAPADRLSSERLSVVGEAALAVAGTLSSALGWDAGRPASRGGVEGAPPARLSSTS
jgi:DNA-binding IclR family transcriptional regulator